MLKWIKEHPVSIFSFIGGCTVSVGITGITGEPYAFVAVSQT